MGGGSRESGVRVARWSPAGASMPQCLHLALCHLLFGSFPLVPIIPPLSPRHTPSKRFGARVASPNSRGKLQTMTGLEEKVTGLEQTVTALDQTMTGLEQTMTGLGQSVTGLEQTVTGLEQSETGLGQTVTGLEQTFTSLLRPSGLTCCELLAGWDRLHSAATHSQSILF